ncbi:hypothetical protein J437_LFUL011763, partial [Ladona fulva]
MADEVQDVKEVASVKEKQKLIGNFLFKKRLPPRLPRKKNEVYANKKSSFKAQLSRCEKLLQEGENEIIIHGLGAAVVVAANLALHLRERFHQTVELDVRTDTVDIIGGQAPPRPCGCPPRPARPRRHTAMFFSLEELVQWLGLTVFEMWVFLASLSLFTILVALGAEGALPAADPPNSGSLSSAMHRQPSPWLIFSPLFVADALNTYFCAIVFVRMYLEGTYKAALLRASWSLSLLVLLFVFKFLLCEKLSGRSTLEYSEVLAPVFILLQLVA